LTINWTSSQPFVQAAAGTMGVSMSASTTVSITGSGTATYSLSGGIDGQVLTQFPQQPPTLSGVTPVSLTAAPESYASLAAGNHVLQMGWTVVFTPTSVGDTITVDSVYSATPATNGTPVPAVPGPMTLVAVGLLAGAGLLLSRRRPARA
jgi:hypothetical protein